jgi:hypothetical protein
MNELLIGNKKLINSLGIKTKKNIYAPGNLIFESFYNNVLNNYGTIFQLKNDLVHTKVGLKWALNKFPKLNKIIYIGEVVPVNTLILKNHIIIANKILSLDDAPIEWNLDTKISSLVTNSENKQIIRNSINKNNLDFMYGDILSINPLHQNPRTLQELKSSNICDAIDNLSFIINEFAKINQLSIFNIFIGTPESYILNKKLDVKLITDHIFSKNK